MWWWKFYLLSFLVILSIEILLSFIVPTTLPFTVLELTLAFLGWYLLSPYLMIIAFRLRPTKDENLIRLATYSSALLGVKAVKIYEIRANYLNALAFGNLFFNAIAVTKPLVEGLNDREIVAVLSHEFAHIKNKDTEIQMLYILGINLAYIVTSFYLFPASLLVLLLGILSMFFLHRKLEKRADITAARIAPWIAEYLSYALIKIAYLSHTVPTSMLKYFPEFQLFFIKQSLLGSREKEGFFSTHPSLSERLRYLEELANTYSNKSPSPS